MNKFVLAENPMREGDTSLYIVHLLDPVAIIEVEENHVEYHPGKFYKHFTHGFEQYTLSIHFLFSRELDSEQHHAIVDKMLDKAWRWFRAYMEWEDKQIKDDENQ